MPVEMRIKGLILDPVSDMPIVILRNLDGVSMLPIWVGVFEAGAIAAQLEKVIPPRPYTHDLLRSIIEAVGARVEKVVITDLKDDTYYAVIHLDLSGAALTIDARPSDAMALALRSDAPIYVEERVLEKSLVAADDTSNDEAERLRKWLEHVDPEELGKYMM